MKDVDCVCPVSAEGGTFTPGLQGRQSGDIEQKRHVAGKPSVFRDSEGSWVDRREKQFR